jgi:hypothetical protein
MGSTYSTQESDKKRLQVSQFFGWLFNVDTT